ncbi:MAG: SipW-dependent-type signal peptide-containing protein [Propionicimonas sp.]|uniref:SipW-dependent-type signal peptide-containing protein n=1 Tax=Propionicimonas sp. TaxID=1955623 RepID=UPI001DA756B7|nr:SipW-dependent-type signal peptide-containing protein [Propionicimonas sp.]MBU4188023.1 SipW-dependent-type signal peptide-containing protein [Actinomycetota bacterium]MBU4207749.1 SipW-dependent-type signal peptide-containing protein [Actinomycetota bacterium]MBU4249445.1 SipW-dependent-type signal peptide-containing protein [Actinomycetota bacterium]MBU4362868.1 SipW-dependent-type signal peptide-containing protein [Actinomycetota bacterium]MBU4410392.1 SipW-dependent-type signal peptide-
MTSTTTADRRGRRRKLAAILAGGLVVGVGTMATLASWNDAEYASGSFTAGRFNLLGSVDQSAFGEHASAGAAAALTFTAPVTALTPGDVVYAPYALRLDDTTTNGGTVAVTPGASTGTVTNVTYTLFNTATAGCSAASTPVTTVVANGTDLGSVGTPLTFAVAKPVLPSAGAITYLCFKVTAGAALGQGQTGTASWVFTATSN